MHTQIEITDNLELCLETISGIINATGTKEQRADLLKIKSDITDLLAADGEEYIEIVKETMDLLSSPSFNMDFIKDEVNTIKFNLSSLSTLKLKDVLENTRKVLKDANVEIEEVEEEVVESIMEPEVDPEVARMIEEELEKELNTNTKKEEEMKTKNEEVKQEKTTGAEKVKETKQEKTIRELREKLAKSKDKANKCKTSTIAKIGKVTLGVGLLAGAAAGGYYAAKKFGGINTTIILNGNDEE